MPRKCTIATTLPRSIGVELCCLFENKVTRTKWYSTHYLQSKTMVTIYLGALSRNFPKFRPEELIYSLTPLGGMLIFKPILSVWPLMNFLWNYHRWMPCDICYGKSPIAQVMTRSRCYQTTGHYLSQYVLSQHKTPPGTNELKTWGEFFNWFDWWL